MIDTNPNPHADLPAQFAARAFFTADLIDKAVSEVARHPRFYSAETLYKLAHGRDRAEAAGHAAAAGDYFTVHAIADAIKRFCAGAQEVYLCGGGAHNRALVAQLERALPHCRIEKTDLLGISADWMEAIAFAWLARQAMHGQCANLPAVTGARHSCILGAIYQA